MPVLALDTSSAAVTAAVVDISAHGVRALAERVTVNARGHGELLAPSIHACLRESDCRPADLSAVVAGVGPGPYTGLRVGLVTAAVFAATLGIPAYGVCSLDAITPDGDLDGDVVVAGDARRKEVYWARYDPAGRRVDGPHVARPEDVPFDGVLGVLGAGAELYAERFACPLLDAAPYPRAAALVAAAGPRLRTAAPSEPLTPMYLRRPDAVANPTVKPVSR